MFEPYFGPKALRIPRGCKNRSIYDLGMKSIKPDVASSETATLDTASAVAALGVTKPKRPMSAYLCFSVERMQVCFIILTTQLIAVC